MSGVCIHKAVDLPLLVLQSKNIILIDTLIIYYIVNKKRNTKSRFYLAYKLQVQARSAKSSVEKSPFIKVHRVTYPFAKSVFH